MQVRGIVALVVTLSACGDDTPPSVVGTEERARLEAALAARVAAVRTRCPADDSPALRALVEPTGELAACVDRYRRARTTRRAIVRAPVLVATAFGCGTVIDATVAAAAADDAACSPYVLGARPDDEPRYTELAVADLIVERARQLADAGETSTAMELLVDAARAIQALARGPVNQLRMMLSNAMRTKLVDAALALPPSSVDGAVVAKLDAAITHEPAIIDSLVTDSDYVAVHMRPSSPDDIASLLAHADAMRRAFESACPAAATTTLRACHTALRALAPSTAAGTRGFHEELVRSTTRALDDVEADRREAVVGESLDQLGPFGASYVAHAAEQLSALVAWRLALEVARTGRCPLTSDLAAPPLAALRSPPLLGDTVDTTVTADTLDIAPPAWARAAHRPARSWSIRCP